MKPKIVDINIYRCSVVLLKESTKEEWRQWYEEYKDQISEKDNYAVLEEYDSDNLGFCVGTEGNDYICMISDGNNAGLVAHELFHAADMILSDRGYKFNGVDEPVAYLLEYLVNTFLNYE